MRTAIEVAREMVLTHGWCVKTGWDEHRAIVELAALIRQERVVESLGADPELRLMRALRDVAEITDDEIDDLFPRDDDVDSLTARPWGLLARTARAGIRRLVQKLEP